MDEVVKLPEGTYGYAVLAQDTAQGCLPCSEFSQEMAAACSIATDSKIPFNTSSLNVNPRVVSLHHQLVTLHAHWALHCHCYKWTTARILIVARRLGGLKASNDVVNGKGSSESVPVRSHTAEPCLYRINIDESVYFQKI
ncbi:BQ5605_C001g00421 [Microbotryum silenes-dioicae]|uniref:BQ5605_C001g00421 protein n=1 Tax=Microbotryum silenes-dioicae TaxID=796604 RepID=A0A2X0P040_9BASI|nr:BQ5605_C001g00421 [Microbotryum silenes-dioicae]